MRRLVCEYYDGFSFGTFMRQHPEMRGTVTDLLIGDLFTDRVDEVWAPMEAMYPDNKHVIPTWDAGVAGRRGAGKGERAVPAEGPGRNLAR